MRTDEIIKQEGFNALSKRLDIVEVERFFMLIKRENIDYTQWRVNLLENFSIEELSKKAMNHINLH